MNSNRSDVRVKKVVFFIGFSDLCLYRSDVEELHLLLKHLKNNVTVQTQFVTQGLKSSFKPLLFFFFFYHERRKGKFGDFHVL